MKASTDEAEFAEALLDTPFNAPRNPSNRREAMQTPGCHLKSKEVSTTGNRWPKYYGRLTTYDEKSDRVVVVSKPPHEMGGVDGKPTVWTGTVSQYVSFWECD